MKNLKKVLSLVLALAMASSLMATALAKGTGEYADSDKITNTEAVSVLSALNVINGKGDGTNFDPEGNVTRAEMAKMITMITLGNVDVDAFAGAPTTLTDVNMWAKAYIKYCYSQGIIAGRGNNKFSPNDNVTAAEAAKMLLVSIGYNAQVQGYLSGNWKLNVIRDAQQSKFFDGLSVSTDKVLTRDEAAKMIYNAVDATMIQKTSSKDRVDGSITDSYAPYGDNRDLLSETFGARRSTVTFNGDNNIVSALSKGEISVTSEANVNTNMTAGTATAAYTMPNGNAWIGEKVELLWKDNEKKGTKNTLDKFDTVFGVYNNGETQVLNVTKADITKAADYTTAGKIKVAGAEYDLPNITATTEIIVKNYGADTAESATSTSDAKTKYQALSAKNGDAVKFIINDNKVTKAYVVETKLGTVTAVTSEKVSINGLGTIKIADNEVYKDIAKNDVVTFTKLYNSDAEKATVTVEKAEVVNGKVDGFKTTKVVTLNGTEYKIYNETAMPTAVAGETGVASFASGHIGETFDLYMVNGYVAGAVQVSEAANNYSLVIDKNSGVAGSTMNPLKLEVLAADGTKSAITVSDKGATTINKGDIVTYTGDADNAKIKVETPVSGKTTSTAAFYNKDTKTVEGMVTTANAALFVRTTNSPSAKYEAYEIRSLNDINTTGKAIKVITNSDGKVVAAYIELDAKPAGAASTTVYGIVTADKGTVKIGDDVYQQYTIWAGKDIVVNLTTGTLTEGDLVEFDPTADNTYANATAFEKTVTNFGTAGEEVYVKDYNTSDKTITFYTAANKVGDIYEGDKGTQKTLAVKDDVVIVYVDKDGKKAGSEIGVNAFNAMTGYKNAILVKDADDAVTHIIVETSDKCNINGTTTQPVEKLTVNKPAEVAASGNQGAYEVTAKPADTAKGQTVTVNVKCTQAPKANFQDKVTLTGTGITGETTVTFTSAEASQAKNITFTMPAANVSDLALKVTNEAVKYTITKPGAVTGTASNDNSGAVTFSVGQMTKADGGAVITEAAVGEEVELAITVTNKAQIQGNGITVTVGGDGVTPVTASVDFTTGGQDTQKVKFTVTKAATVTLTMSNKA